MVLAPAHGWHSSDEMAARDALAQRLIRTHFVTCQGTQVFCDFFLNLRGGLSPSVTSEIPISSSASAEQRENIIRGVRRILALGWLSVEDSEKAETSPFRVPDIERGHRLTEQDATRLLTSVLREKGETRDDQIREWCQHCIPALTACVREDSVWVNRHQSFSRMTPQPTPEEAFQILTKVFGKKFLKLDLPDDLKVDEDGEDDESAEEVPQAEESEESDPSNKGRAIFCDLFGQGPKAAFDKTAEFAARVKTWIEATLEIESDVSDGLIRSRLPSLFVGNALPAFPSDELRKKNPKKTLLYVPETVSGKRLSKLAVRFRKLLVRIGWWDALDGEQGSPEQPLATLLKDLSKACDEEMQKGDRVLNPAWGSQVLDALSSTTGLRFGGKPDDNGKSPEAGPLGMSPSEFGYLMAGLAARRVSQTHSWMKRNELKRHVSKLKEDAARRRLIELDPDNQASSWLRSYELQRHKDTGAEREYRITSRAIGGAEEVGSAFRSCDTKPDRLKAVQTAQAEVEKFGDPDLFIELAEATWVTPRASEFAEILKAWARFRRAEADQRRWKIPRFCHPDAFRHPTFCEFGDNSKPKVQYGWRDPEPPGTVEEGGTDDGERCFWLQLPTPNGLVKYVPIRWRSKRLWKELGGNAAATSDQLSRNHRLGLADAELNVPTKPISLFRSKAKGWNARLQADRNSLLRLATVWDSTTESWLDGGKRLRQLPWFVTFSPDLPPSSNQWQEFKNQNREQWEIIQRLNERRKGRARFELARLPGLRVVSVDLGHRYAAACAVWETVTTKTVEDACKQAKVPVPKPTALFVFVPKAEHGHTLFRRIGSDKIGDKDHPAPWARLDRQFLIKLQGEDQPARWAIDEEKKLVKSLESDLGYVRDDDNQLSGDDWRVDRLMSEALRTVRLALRRHSDYACIADGLIATDRPGMGRNAREKLEGDKLIEHLQDVLVRWHSLATSKRWQDDFAAKEWEKHIPEIKLTKQADDLTGPQRKALTKKLREQLEPVAKRLATTDRFKMSGEWAQKWRANDGQPAKAENEVDQAGRKTGKAKTIKPATGWHSILARLVDRITLRGRKRDKFIRHMGGLSLTRVTTFTELYQLQKAFYARLQLDPTTGRILDPRAIAGRRFAQRLLDQRDAMRENRVKQLASRIAEAALGIGIEKPRGETGRQLKRPRERLDRTLGQRFAPCHAVVIENLTRYRPDELQTRRENRQLMSWSSARVKKYLSEACQLHGLHLREVQPSYTSRQDFRTGAPGVRCVDVTVAEFPKKFVRELKRAVEADKPNALDRYLLDLARKHLQSDGKTPKDNHDKLVLRIPKRGGEIFVAATEVPSSKERKGPPGVQADLNAAGNIGLKALLDPDWQGAWWYVPTVLKDGYRVPQPDKTKGTPVFESWEKMGKSKRGYAKNGEQEVRDDESKPSKTGKKGRAKEVINLWRDVSSGDLSNGEWRVYSAYDAWVRWRVIQQLRKAADLDPDKPTDEENPF